MTDEGFSGFSNPVVFYIDNKTTMSVVGRPITDVRIVRSHNYAEPVNRKGRRKAASRRKQ